MISAVGALNSPASRIPGMETSRGRRSSPPVGPAVDIQGTRFALVGAGASGFQIAPTIADEVEQ